MRKWTIVIGLGIFVFFVGIMLIRLSMFSRETPVEYKEALETSEGSDITDIAIYLPFAGRCGINITGSFQGSEVEPVFHVRDSDGRLFYSSPSFPLPSSSIEFDIDDPGLYMIYFSVTFDVDSRVEVYQYRYEMGIIYPYENLYNVGLLLAVAGLVASAVGAFMPSKKH